MKSFNARKKLCVLLLIYLSCLSFCACKSEALPESSDISQTAVKSDTYQTECEPASEKTEANVEETESEFSAEPFAEATFEPVVIKEEDFYFAPVITEDDIEYMGIPYKDLTQEQFIQLWAQCTRECNVQRLYNLYYPGERHAAWLEEAISFTSKADFIITGNSAEKLMTWLGYGSKKLTVIGKLVLICPQVHNIP